MLNLRTDYGFVGRLFGVPRKLLSQLASFCVTFAVPGYLLKGDFPAFPDPSNPVKLWIDEEELAKFALNSVSDGTANEDNLPAVNQDGRLTDSGIPKDGSLFVRFQSYPFESSAFIPVVSVGEGEVSNFIFIPDTAPTSDKVLTLGSDGSIGWEEGGGSPEDPPSFVALNNVAYPGSTSADTTAWTFDGERGVKERVVTRVVWDSSSHVLYGFYRVKTYDGAGRLYSVSAETRYVIDTAVTYSP